MHRFKHSWALRDRETGELACILFSDDCTNLWNGTFYSQAELVKENVYQYRLKRDTTPTREELETWTVLGLCPAFEIVKEDWTTGNYGALTFKFVKLN